MSLQPLITVSRSLSHNQDENLFLTVFDLRQHCCWRLCFFKSNFTFPHSPQYVFTSPSTLIIFLLMLSSPCLCSYSRSDYQAGPRLILPIHVFPPCFFSFVIIFLPHVPPMCAGLTSSFYQVKPHPLPEGPMIPPPPTLAQFVTNIVHLSSPVSFFHVVFPSAPCQVLKVRSDVLRLTDFLLF